MSNKDFLLNEDLKENRQFQLIVDGTTIRQENGTNPRIRKIGTDKRLQYAAIGEFLPEYEARIVLGSSMNFRVESIYQIRFSQDMIKTYKCVAIEPSYEQGLYVKVILALDNQVT